MQLIHPEEASSELLSGRRVLLVVRESLSRQLLLDWYQSDGFEVQTCETYDMAVSMLRGRADFDLCFAEADSGSDAQSEFLIQARNIDPDLPVLLLVPSSGAERARSSQIAYEVLSRPFHLDHVLHLSARAVEHRRAKRELRWLRESVRELSPPTALIGSSEQMQRVAEFVRRAAPLDANVVITGESGSGKEIVARAIHGGGARRDMPIVTVHCGALEENDLEAVLFGPEKDHAEPERKGKLDLADGGTLFLDEISEVPWRVQSTLLNALETRTDQSESGTARIRCIASTSSKLLSSVREGKFRPDLFCRLNVLHIDIPPLRERIEDIAPLAEYFVRRHCAQTNRSKVPVIGSDVLEILHAYPWPGNVRELQNAVERALVVNTGTELKPEDFSFEFTSARQAGLGQTLDDVERVHIERISRHCKGNLSKTARILNIDRTTLYNKLRKYGMR